MPVLRKGISYPMRFANGRMSTTSDTQLRSSKLIENIKNFVKKVRGSVIWNLDEGTDLIASNFGPGTLAYWEGIAQDAKLEVEQAFPDVLVHEAGVIVGPTGERSLYLKIEDTLFGTEARVDFSITQGGLV